MSTAQNQRLLKLPDYGCRFTAHGTTDLVLVRTAAADSGLLLAATFLLFELKKPSSGPTPSSWDIQACCELLSVSMNQYRPMVVLTDLNYVWRIFWLEGKVINRRSATFLETAALVQALTRQYAPLEARAKAERSEDDGRIEGTIIHRERKRPKQDGDVALLSDICTPTESEEAFYAGIHGCSHGSLGVRAAAENLTPFYVCIELSAFKNKVCSVWYRH